MTVLNKAQVDALFRREAVLLGSRDGVPVSSAAVLFGEAAVKFAYSGHSGEYWNGYGVGDYTLVYLTYRGFLAAASYYNVQQLWDDMIEAPNYHFLPGFTVEKT